MQSVKFKVQKKHKPIEGVISAPESCREKPIEYESRGATQEAWCQLDCKMIWKTPWLEGIYGSKMTGLVSYSIEPERCLLVLQVPRPFQENHPTSGRCRCRCLNLSHHLHGLSFGLTMVRQGQLLRQSALLQYEVNAPCTWRVIVSATVDAKQISDKWLTACHVRQPTSCYQLLLEVLQTRV